MKVKTRPVKQAQPVKLPERPSPYPALGKIFNLAIQDLQKDAKAARDKCFEAALSAIEKGDWNKIESARPYCPQLYDFKGRSLFIACVEREMFPQIKEIIERNLVPSLANNQIEDAIIVAAERGSPDMLFQLQRIVGIDRKNREDKTALHVSIEYGNIEFMKGLLKAGALVTESFEGLDAPAWAISKGSIEAFDVLIQFKKINIKDIKAKVGNALHIAIYFKQEEMLSYLLNNYSEDIKVLLSEKNESDQTPLMLAAYLGDVKIIYTLLSKVGVNLDAANRKGLTALHLAVMQSKPQVVDALLSFGATVDKVDHNQRRPIDLLENKKDDESVMLHAKLLNYARRHQIDEKLFSSVEHPPENLIFQGGGPAGIAHVGAVRALEDKGLMSAVRRISGTSAGAIVATSLALNYTSKELESILDEVSLSDFFDHSLSQVAFKQLVEEPSFRSIIKFTLGEIYEEPLEIYRTLWRSSGICEGKVFLKWIEGLIFNKTGVPNCTFGELQSLRKSGCSFKELYVYATKVTDTIQICSFDTEDSSCKDLIIAHVIGASIAIPGVYRPRTLYAKDSDGKCIPRPDLGAYLDGGLLSNLPVAGFDQKGFITSGLSEEESKEPIFNRRTLGFSLVFPVDNIEMRRNSISNAWEFIKVMLEIYMNAERLIRQQTPSNDKRIISIDRKGVGMTDINIGAEMNQKLILSGYASVNRFFDEPIHIIQNRPILHSIAQQHVISLPSLSDQFISREEVLTDLRDILASSNWRLGKPVEVCLVHGPEGVGKTIIATQFGHSVRDSFSIIYWIDASSQEVLHQNYLNLAKNLQLNINEQEGFKSIRDQVHNCLEQLNHRWLLIFDDVHAAHKPKWPRFGGSVLMTTQESPWEEYYYSIESFTEKEATCFVKQTFPSSSIEECKQLANELDCFPLALYQAVTFIKEEGVSISDYCKEVGKSSTGSGGRMEDMLVASLEKTWECALDKLEMYPKAKQWLNCCAYLNSGEIPEFLLQNWIKTHSEFELKDNVSVAVESRDLLETLSRYSLIKRDKDNKLFSIHKRMQRFLVQKNKDLAIWYFTSMVLVVKTSVNSDDHSQLRSPRSQKILPHLEVLIKHFNHYQELKKDKFELLYLLLRLKQVWGDREETQRVAKKALILGKELYGWKSIQVAHCLGVLGDTYCRMSLYSQAINKYNEALSIYGYFFNKSHPVVITTSYRLGCVFAAMGQYRAAILFYKNALDQSESLKEKDGYPDKDLIVNRLLLAYNLESLVNFSSRL